MRGNKQITNLPNPTLPTKQTCIMLEENRQGMGGLNFQSCLLIFASLGLG